MPWHKGASGNPRGRPRKGTSLAEAIRRRFTTKKRHLAIDQIARLATDPHDAPAIRIAAFETLARRGWPEEARGELAINVEGASAVQVIHKHVSE